MDPSTFRVAFQPNNPGHEAIGTTYVQPLNWNPAVFCRRARVIAGGQVIEDINDFNKLSLMLTSLKSGEEQLMISSEGFNSFDGQYGDVSQDNRKTYRNFDYDKSGSVFEGRRVLFKPMFGLFDQEKLLPLRYMPIQIKLELVNSGADAVHEVLGKDKLILRIGLSVIPNANVTYSLWAMPLIMGMRAIFSVANRFLSIS